MASRKVTGPRIAVIGGSLGGLLAANMLWRAGCDVTVHERIGEELSGRGVGMASAIRLACPATASGWSTTTTVVVSLPVSW